MRTTLVFLAFTLFAQAVAAEDLAAVGQAERQGITRCMPAIKEGSELTVGSQPHSSRATWNTAAPNDRMFNSTMVINYQGAGSSVGILSAAPTLTNRCDAVRTVVMPVPMKSCPALREAEFKDWTSDGETQGLVTLKMGERTMLMMPMNSGCVLVVNEVYYE